MTENHIAVCSLPADSKQLFPGALLHAGFFRQAQSNQAATAAVWEEDGATRTLSYGALREWAWRFSAWLQELNIEHEGPALAAVVLPKGWLQAAAVLGVTWSGAAYVPMDVSWPADRMLEVLEETGCRAVIGTDATRPNFAGSGGLHWLSVEALQKPGQSPEQTAAQWASFRTHEPLPVGVQSTDPAYVIYTSGSTGRPKGVVMEHGAVCVTLAEVARRWEICGTDRVLAVSPLSFDLSVFDIFGVLAAGGAVVFPAEKQRREPSAWLRLASTVTIWNSVPILMQTALEELTKRGEARWPGPLRLVMLSRDWIPLGLPARIRAVAEGASVVNLGGITEAGIWSAAYELDKADPLDIAEWRAVPYGTALSGQTVQVLRGGEDGQLDLTPCGPWTAGRIFIGGSALARGYCNDSAQTERCLIVSKDGERLWETGDLGRTWPDGTIELLGRVDRQVKVQGYPVDVSEIENTLMRHPTVSSAAVKAFEAASGAIKLAAYVVPRSTAGNIDVPALRTFLDENLPRYMIPMLQAVPELPRNGNDKIDFAALLAPSREGRHDAEEDSGSQLAALQVAAQQVLHIPFIAPDQNLLELGANSIDILTIIALIESEVNIEVDIEAFFANPTLLGVLQMKEMAQGQI